MEIKIFLVLIALQICHLCSASILKLSGRVPDRGVVVKDGRVEPAKNTDMKLLVAEADRTQWRVVKKSELVRDNSILRVEAP